MFLHYGLFSFKLFIRKYIYMNKIMNVILSLTLIIQAAVFQVALPNLILCIGDDGHIALEWQEEQEHCRHNNLVNKTVFNDTENIHSGSQEVDCTDIGLHFHSSYAYKTQKGNKSINIAKIYGQQQLLVVNKFNKSRFTFITPTNLCNPTIELVKTTVLTI